MRMRHRHRHRRSARLRESGRCLRQRQSDRSRDDFVRQCVDDEVFADHLARPYQIVGGKLTSNGQRNILSLHRRGLCECKRAENDSQAKDGRRSDAMCHETSLSSAIRITYAPRFAHGCASLVCYEYLICTCATQGVTREGAAHTAPQPRHAKRGRTIL